MKRRIIRYFFLPLILLAVSGSALLAQEPVPGADTTQPIEILSHTKRLTFQTIDDSTRITIIVGDVKLRQGRTLFYADSCLINKRINLFEAWGKVHINDSDTAHVYANHLRYLMDKKIAYLDGNVRLTDGKGTLTTPDLEYDMQTNIGVYKNGGKVINDKTVLTSKEGWYYADMRDIYFKQNVVLNDPAYKIVTDSLLYNTETKTTRFISFTTITDSSGRVIKTREGYYNQQTGKAEFGLRPEIQDGDVNITANSIEVDDSTGIFRATGNAVIIDEKNNTTLLGGIIIRNKNTDAILATRKPLMIVKQDNDSIYIAADTLFSARLSDKTGMDSIITDTATGMKVAAYDVKDSTNRYFEAFRNVRIFNDSLQAACDSLFYSFRDSIFRLYDDPVVWAQNSQITGDTILLYTKNKKADKVEAYENGFMINRADTAAAAFNQIRSSRIDGWFTEGNIDSVRASGFAECIYYIQDQDSAYTGINESKSDIIDIYFQKKELERVVFRSAVTGTIWPIRQKSPDEMQLPNFRWQESRRPKTKYELFE